MPRSEGKKSASESHCETVKQENRPSNAFYIEIAKQENQPSVAIAERDGAITHVFFSTDDVPAYFERRETSLLLEARRQLMEYFAGERKEFDLPLSFEGTHFSKSVWESLCAIPYGETVSYGELAAKVGCPKAARAVGSANNKNPLPIFVPCHRVIGANGKLVGYRGGLAMKAALLSLEKDGSYGGI